MSVETKKWGEPVTPLSGGELADHHAVSQLCKAYAIGMDLRDYDLARSAFAPDAMIESKNGMEPVDESLLNTYEMASSFHATQHFIGNQYVDLNATRPSSGAMGLRTTRWRREKSGTRSSLACNIAIAAGVSPKDG